MPDFAAVVVHWRSAGADPVSGLLRNLEGSAALPGGGAAAQFLDLVEDDGGDVAGEVTGPAGELGVAHDEHIRRPAIAAAPRRPIVWVPLGGDVPAQPWQPSGELVQPLAGQMRWCHDQRGQGGRVAEHEAGAERLAEPDVVGEQQPPGGVHDVGGLLLVGAGRAGRVPPAVWCPVPGEDAADGLFGAAVFPGTLCQVGQCCRGGGEGEALGEPFEVAADFRGVAEGDHAGLPLAGAGEDALEPDRDVRHGADAPHPVSAGQLAVRLVLTGR